MSLDSTDGTLTCISCKKNIPVTDFEHHEFGSAKNSRYMNKYADKNRDIHTDGFTDSDAISNGGRDCYIPFQSGADRIKAVLCKKPVERLLYRHAFKKILKERRFVKLYVPVRSYKVITKASINAACTEFDENTTNYFDVEKHAELLFENFTATATTGNGSLHIDSLFPFDLKNAVCTDDGIDTLIGNKKTDDVMILEADIPSDRYNDNIKKYADRAAKDKLNTLLSSYASVHNKIFECDSHISESRLIYLPVWKIPFGGKDASECLYVNDTTGKCTNRPPVSRVKSALLITITFAVIFAALITVACFAGI